MDEEPDPNLQKILEKIKLDSLGDKITSKALYCLDFLMEMKDDQRLVMGRELCVLSKELGKEYEKKSRKDKNPKEAKKLQGYNQLIAPFIAKYHNGSPREV